ncbi:MAG: glycosyltransferase family 4 protein [Gammaproteobacteria bacterium]
MKIAYIVNQYPKGSHSFIRREILALERQGLEVLRLAIRGWNDPLPDAQDRAERGNTTYVLQAGGLRLLIGAVRIAVSRPRQFIGAFSLALRMSRRSEKSILFHCIYFIEACAVANLLIRSGATHIHAHFGTNSAEVAMLAGALTQRPFSFTAHGTAETDSPVGIGLAEKIRRASFVVAVSYFVRSQLYRWVDYPHWSKIHVVRCGLEKSFYANSENQELSAANRRFVSVGRLSPEKGQMLLLAALRQVLDSGRQCSLTLVGDGEMRADIERQIEALRLEQNVHITGWLSSEDVSREILAARALILPSFAEGLPVVLMEAMALRRPVLSTHVSGIPELVTHKNTGWLFPPGDIASISAAIQACLDEPEAELRRMGERAHACAVENHDIDNEARRLKSLFLRACPDTVDAAARPAPAEATRESQSALLRK